MCIPFHQQTSMPMPSAEAGGAKAGVKPVQFTMQHTPPIHFATFSRSFSRVVISTMLHFSTFSRVFVSTVLHFAVFSRLSRRHMMGVRVEWTLSLIVLFLHLQLFRAQDLPEEKERILRNLGAVSNPAMMQRVLDFSLTVSQSETI